jgi:hypothetical protein
VGYLTLWPAGQLLPPVVTLSALDAQTTAAAAIVPAGAQHAVNFWATGPTDLVVDANGYFAAPGQQPNDLLFVPTQPCRLVDTRNAPGLLGGPILASGTTRDFPVTAGNCTVPPNALAFAVNFNVVPTGMHASLAVWATGTDAPRLALLSSSSYFPVANAAIVAAGTSSSISVSASDETQLVIDLNGYFVPRAQ